MLASLKRISLIIVGLCVVSCAGRLQKPEEQWVTPLTRSTQPALLHIRVRIYGGGSPLQNVQVELYYNQFEPVPGELVTTAITNEEGLADLKIEPGTYGFWVRALDMSAQWRYDGPTRFTFSRDGEIQIHMLPAY